MASIEDVAVNVLVEAPECPSSVAEHMVLRAARELFKETLCWRTLIEYTYDTNSNTTETSQSLGQANILYLGKVPYLSTDYSPELVQVLSMTPTANGASPLTPKTEQQLDRERPGWRYERAAEPLFWTNDGGNPTEGFDNPDRFRLIPQPTYGGGLKTIETTTTGISQAEQAVINFSGDHTFAVEDRVHIFGASNMTNYWNVIDDSVYRVVAVPSSTSIRIPIDTSSLGDTFINSLAGDTPSVAKVTLDIRVAIRPDRTATNLPDTVLLHTEEAIIARALYHVLSMPNAYWYNPQSAQIYDIKYQKEVSIIKSRADDGFQTSTIRKVGYGGL